MHQLLDFLYEYSLDELVYCVLPARDGELTLSFRAADPHCWEVRRTGAVEAARPVPRAELVAFLTECGADLALLEEELSGLVAAHIVVADQLLAAAHRTFGRDGVSAVLRGQQQLSRDLREALSSLLAPRLRLVR